MSYQKVTPPDAGEIIQFSNGKVQPPTEPIIPFIEGDGIGPDIWRAASRVIDAAVEKAFGGRRRIHWFEIYAGQKAQDLYGQWLPEDTLQVLRDYRVGIKGPLTTPVGGGIRSLNVAIRQALDLYACVRPVRWFQGVPSPMKEPQKLDVVIFRENTEDVYAGIEWAAGSQEANDLIEFIKTRFGKHVRLDSGLGLKPISKTGTRRLVRKAIQYALDEGLCSVTLVHKGNIMKYTEGAFRDWGYELARDEFPYDTVTEDEVATKYQGRQPPRLLIKDRIADAMFQQVLLRPDEYELLCTPNLNGDYLSDACAAQVGGLGMAPGANIGDRVACFEATHGTAPKYAGQDKVNPGSLILSGEMMLRHIGWHKAAELVVRGVEQAISQKLVTYDLERQMEGAKLLKCSEFATAVIEHME